MVVANKGGVCLHASTIAVHGSAVCFSAGSGTGKTTHTRLWREVFSGVQVINGDNGYLFAKDGTAYF